MKRLCVHATQLCNGSQFIYHYSKVSNRRGLWNSRGGWKKSQKLIVSGEGGWKKLKIIIPGALAFKLLFSFL